MQNLKPKMQTVPRTYTGLSKLAGPILVIDNIDNVAYAEIVEIEAPDGTIRNGRVLEISDKYALVQVFEGTYGLATETTSVRFLGRPLLARVSEQMLGRVFDGLGNPIDGDLSLSAAIKET